MGRICFFLAYGLLPIWVALFVILKEGPDAYGVTLWALIIGVLISVVTFCLAVCTSFVYDKVKGSHVRKLLVSGSFLLVINAAFAVIRYRDHKLEANQEAFRKRIEQAAESLVKYDPFVKEQSIGDPLHFGAVWSRMGGNRLPTRVTVSVGQESRQNLYAEVDVEATITSQGTLGEVKMALACVTKLSTSQRDSSWNDVCIADRNARRLPPAEKAARAPFDFVAYEEERRVSAKKLECGFSDVTFPKRFSLYATWAYAGRKLEYQIDQSGGSATQIDVVVNSPGKPVILMLGAHDPTIWNVSRSSKTRIAAVLAIGQNRQAVAGLDEGTPMLISFNRANSPCSIKFPIYSDLSKPSGLAKHVFGYDVDAVFPVTNAKVVIGKPLESQTLLLQSEGVTPKSFYDKDAPIAGPKGVEYAQSQGILRQATAADFRAWYKAKQQLPPDHLLPPAPGRAYSYHDAQPMLGVYVVLKPFHFPAGLYGGHSAAFIIPEGLPKPTGDPGHSRVYDFNTLECRGVFLTLAVRQIS